MDERIIEAILDNDEQAHELYLHSAWFRAALDTLVREYLPLLINGMVARAEAEERRRQEYYDGLLHEPRAPINLDEL